MSRKIFPYLYTPEKVEIRPGQGRHLKVWMQRTIQREILAESVMYNEQDLNYDFRIPERLYNFQHNNKQVFVENYSVNPVQLSARKRIGTISCVEPAINKEYQNAWNERLGLRLKPRRENL